MYREKPTCGVYKITNNISGKSYVGLSVDIFRRWKQHSNTWEAKKRWSAIKAAISKYGIENFTFTVIEECSKEKLSEREIHWIKELNTLAPNGYNRTAGGDTGITKETAVKIAKVRKERGTNKTSDETKAKLSAIGKGRPQSEEHVKARAKSRQRPCVINDVEFACVEDAVSFIGRSHSMIHKYLKEQVPWPKGFSGYYK